MVGKVTFYDLCSFCSIAIYITDKLQFLITIASASEVLIC